MRIYKTLVICFLLGLAFAQDEEHEDYIDEEEGGDAENQIEDPCRTKQCGVGKDCAINERGRAVCICAHECPVEEDPRAKVCSTQNVTFASECELNRQKCICHRKGAGCLDWRNKHAHLDYFGECQQIAVCQREELMDYPKRMREWLYLVMEDLASRKDLGQKDMKLAEKAKRHSKRWLIPVIWQFCQLDKSRDKVVDSEELLPISAPLKALEHCTGSFLSMCDSDRSGEISLEEWGVCLGLDREEIEDLCGGSDDEE